MQEKLAIINSKRVGKQNSLHFQPKMQWMICTTLDFVRPVSLDIWRIERYVCGLASIPLYPQWSITDHVLSKTRMLQSGFYSSKLYFLNRYKFLIRALFPLLNGTLYHRYIVSALKIVIYDNIVCFCLQTSEMYVILNIIQFLYEN